MARKKKTSRPPVPKDQEPPDFPFSLPEERGAQKLKSGSPAFPEAAYGQEFGWDETFAFIAGFTENGIPFGITHEENEENEE